MPFRGPSGACFTTFLMSSYLAAFSRWQVRSTTDTLGVGTRKAMPVSFPFSSGMTLPTPLATPVEAGMMCWVAPRPSRHSFPEGPSTVFWVAVMAMTLARGAKQLVVQDALLTILRELSYFSWFTPITNMGASVEGAEMMTLLAPPFK
uniref:Secreted protein n=1 Tax=Oryctolagus cuniculus TaxID=9986 RepID=A0A5F9DUW1_RABIT